MQVRLTTTVRSVGHRFTRLPAQRVERTAGSGRRARRAGMTLLTACAIQRLCWLLYAVLGMIHNGLSVSVSTLEYLPLLTYFPPILVRETIRQSRTARNPGTVHVHVHVLEYSEQKTPKYTNKILMLGESIYIQQKRIRHVS